MLPFIAQRRQPIIRAIVYLSGLLFMQTLDEVSVSAPATKSGLRLLLLPLVIEDAHVREAVGVMDAALTEWVPD